jgi:transposase
MKYKFILGVDVSKQWLDVVLLLVEEKENIQHIQISNDAKGMSALLKWLKEFNDFELSQALFCMEHTGIYNYPLLSFLVHHECDVWVENPVHIKKSLGVQRGKNDKIDAKRIAVFAVKNIDELKLWKPVREEVSKIKHLTALRERLIESKKKLLVPVEEFNQMGNKLMARMLEKSMSHAIKGIDKDIEQTEKQIKDIIDSDSDLKRLFSLVTSVVGVGFVSAVNLLVCTNEFKMFTEARKFACYCGIAPFEYSSGSSIRGRTRVSQMANKKMKTLLHMASMAAIKFDSGLRQYYDRKVAEGKNKMSVLNAIRNKLVQRIFAVVNRGYAYVKKTIENDLVLS